MRGAKGAWALILVLCVSNGFTEAFLWDMFGSSDKAGAKQDQQETELKASEASHSANIWKRAADQEEIESDLEDEIEKEIEAIDNENDFENSLLNDDSEDLDGYFHERNRRWLEDDMDRYSAEVNDGEYDLFNHDGLQRQKRFADLFDMDDLGLGDLGIDFSDVGDTSLDFGDLGFDSDLFGDILGEPNEDDDDEEEEDDEDEEDNEDDDEDDDEDNEEVIAAVASRRPYIPLATKSRVYQPPRNFVIPKSAEPQCDERFGFCEPQDEKSVAEIDNDSDDEENEEISAVKKQGRKNKQNRPGKQGRKQKGNKRRKNRPRKKPKLSRAQRLQQRRERNKKRRERNRLRKLGRAKGREMRKKKMLEIQKAEKAKKKKMLERQKAEKAKKKPQKSKKAGRRKSTRVRPWRNKSRRTNSRWTGGRRTTGRRRTYRMRRPTGSRSRTRGKREALDNLGLNDLGLDMNGLQGDFDLDNFLDGVDKIEAPVVQQSPQQTIQNSEAEEMTQPGLNPGNPNPMAFLQAQPKVSRPAPPRGIFHPRRAKTQTKAPSALGGTSILRALLAAKAKQAEKARQAKQKKREWVKSILSRAKGSRPTLTRFDPNWRRQRPTRRRKPQKDWWKKVAVPVEKMGFRLPEYEVKGPPRYQVKNRPKKLQSRSEGHKMNEKIRQILMRKKSEMHNRGRRSEPNAEAQSSNNQAQSILQQAREAAERSRVVMSGRHRRSALEDLGQDDLDLDMYDEEDDDYSDPDEFLDGSNDVEGPADSAEHPIQRKRRRTHGYGLDEALRRAQLAKEERRQRPKPIPKWWRPEGGFVGPDDEKPLPRSSHHPMVSYLLQLAWDSANKRRQRGRRSADMDDSPEADFLAEEEVDITGDGEHIEAISRQLRALPYSYGYGEYDDYDNDDDYDDNDEDDYEDEEDDYDSDDDADDEEADDDTDEADLEDSDEGEESQPEDAENEETAENVTEDGGQSEDEAKEAVSEN